MPSCEMCGSVTRLFRTVIEGTELKVCEKCSKFGKVIAAVKEPVKLKKSELKAAQDPRTPLKATETIQVVVDDYPQLIKQKRERLGLKQEELARALAEKESLIHKLESGQFEPSVSLARKLEKYLHITLIEQHEEKHEPGAKGKSDQLTIGDLLTMK